LDISEIGFVLHNRSFLIEIFSATDFTDLHRFLTLIAQGTQRGFGRQAFFGKAFSRSELL
jgi:hypothetical protein